MSQWIPGKVFPTWNVERKILYWTYLNHKHLGTPLTESSFEPAEPYLTNWKTDYTEVSLVGVRQILENLVAHGFAKDVSNIGQKEVLINSDGLLAGSLLSQNYHFFSKEIDHHNTIFLKPSINSSFGFNLLAIAAWSIILLSMLFLSFQLLLLSGLIDKVKNWISSLPSFWESFLVYLFFLPPVLLIVGIVFIVIKPIGKFSAKNYNN